MKILLPVSLAVCAAFTGCLPPPPTVVVAHGHPHYRYEREYEPYRRHEEIVVVSRTCPAPRVEVRGRIPYPGAVWVQGHWNRRHGDWVWIPGHWSRRY